MIKQIIRKYVQSDSEAEQCLVEFNATIKDLQNNNGMWAWHHYLHTALGVYMKDLEADACLSEIMNASVLALRDLERANAALKDLWTATNWGAGKGAAFEAHKRAILNAGIQNIGD